MKTNGSLSEATVDSSSVVTSPKRPSPLHPEPRLSRIVLPVANHGNGSTEKIIDIAGTSYGKMELVLNELGMICDWNSQFRNWLGYRRSDLVFRHISVLLPKLADIKLMCGKQINPRLRFLFRVGYQFQLVSFAGNHVEGTLFINEMENRGRRYLRTIIYPISEWTDAQYAIDI
ncbi:MAG TPA: PAS domain-containing protein [Methylophilaceae bacterium]